MSVPDELPWLKPEFGEQDYGHGCPFSYKGATDCAIVLAMFDHDYMGWHALIQHWDYRRNGITLNGKSINRWEYGLILCCREEGWVPRLVHDFAERRPSFSEATYYVDQYLECPEYLRFMLRG